MGQLDVDNDGPPKGKEEESFPMVIFKDGEKADEVDAVKYKPQKEEGEEKGVMDIISKHAEKSSLSGVAFIQNSKYWVVKCLWTLLLLVSLCVMIYHLHELAKKYFNYEKQTQISLTKGNIKFPAVTLCNVNIMRKRKLYMASERLRNLVEKVNPDQLLKDLEKWDIIYENETTHSNNEGDVIDAADIDSGNSNSTNMYTVSSRQSNFLDDFDTGDIEDDDYFDEDDYSGHISDDSWEASSQKASLDRIYNKFISLYLRENGTTRQQMGHQIHDMLIQCSFNGRKCFQRNFTYLGSSTLGNCYTLQYDKFIARQGGARYGLSLMLYLEADDYIQGITNSKGVQLVIHEPKTAPFPDSEGVAISAGMATAIGLKKIDIRRLGQPHGDCRPTGTFRKKYGLKYTARGCNQVCLMERIRDTCNCYDETKPIFYRRLKSKKRAKMCQRHKDLMMCMSEVKWEFNVNHQSCNCYSPCRETSYTQTVSSKPWPTFTFAKLMAKSVCRGNAESPLCKIDDMDLLSLRENFAKVTIYFESLNYEELNEEEDYTLFQFVSDVGGTIGLYVGLSVLGFFEFGHLFIALVRHFLCPRFTPP